MSLEDTLRAIVREEIRTALAEQAKPVAGEMVSLQEAGKRFHVSIPTIEKWGRQGLTIARRGRVRRVDVDELRAFMKTREVVSAVTPEQRAREILGTVTQLRKAK